jgi:protein involved in polysaccharide export with SLBB domain
MTKASPFIFALMLVGAGLVARAQSPQDPNQQYPNQQLQQNQNQQFQPSLQQEPGSMQPTCSATDPECLPLSDDGVQTSGTYDQDNGISQGISAPGIGVLQRSGEAENAPLTSRTRRQTVPPRPPEPRTEFQNFVASMTGQSLPIFGTSLFQRVPSTFSPSDLNPVSADYLIGPDDQVRLRIWGGTNYSGNLRVDRSGNIYIPQVGAVQVAGLRFSQLDEHLRSAIARQYRNIDLSVELGQIRAIQVYVSGQVRSPGAYHVSSMSTLVDALFASGGPSAQGSMRRVELKRDGRVVASFDLYALLLSGDKSGDARLQPEDVLYVPPAGAQVAVMGSVRQPAIYELLNHETLGQMLTQTGGTTTLASQARISVDRASDSGHREAVELKFDPEGLQTVLRDGDIVRIDSTIPSYRNTVTLRGRVANSGHFNWHPGMTLRDIIPDRDSLLSRDYWWQRAHLGLPSPEFESDVVRPQPLLERFQRNIETSPDAEMANRLSAGLDAAHSSSHASLAAENNAPQNSVAQYNSAQYNAAQNGAPPPSTAPIKVGVRLLGNEIDWSYAVIERTDPNDLKTSLIPFDLGKLVNKHDESQNLPLQAGDTITIFSQDDFHIPTDLQTKYVTVEGEVAHAGTYSVTPEDTLEDVIARAGGLTHKAYLYGSEFTRESARKFQQRRIDEYVQELDLEVRRGTLTTPGSLAGEAAIATGSAAQDRFLEQLRKIRASGRIVLQLEPGTSSVDALPKIELENGDRFIVPPRPATINVVGAVRNANVFLYHHSGQAGNYLKLAGGPTRDADKSKMFIIRADGSVESRDNMKGIFGDAFLRAELNPGDTLVIPDKKLRPGTALRTFLDTSTAFSQLAVGSAAISVLK